MIRIYIKRAIEDIRNNRMITLVTIVTIALSVLIVSSFALFYANIGKMLSTWQEGIRIIAYLKADATEAQIAEFQQLLSQIPDIDRIQFIPKDEALAQLKEQMKHQESLLTHLRGNPLPDSFEVSARSQEGNWDKMEVLASRIKSFDLVEDVEYGQKWLQRIAQMVELFRLAGYGMGAVFLIAGVFIVANTIRLVLYSRKEEIEIMRLVGAANDFIQAPFYLQGLILGGLGGVGGVMILMAAYLTITAKLHQTMIFGFIHLSFLSPPVCLSIVLASMLVGWFGCFLSLRQFLKN